MPAYLIVNYTLEKPELYAEYAAAAGPVMKFGERCQLLALDPKTDGLEGEAGPHTVIVRFDSKAEARAVYTSQDYQAILPKRLGATSGHFAILVDGLPG